MTTPIERRGSSADERSTNLSASVSEEPYQAPAISMDIQAAMMLSPCPIFLLRGSMVIAQNDEAAARTGLDPQKPWPVERIFRGNFPGPSGDQSAEHAGSVEYFECSLICASGKPTMLQGALRDAGDGLRIVAALPQRLDAEAEARHASIPGDLLDSAPEAIAIAHDGRILHVNREFTRLFGHAAEACIGRDIDDLLLPEGKQHENENLYHMVAHEGRASLETVRRSRTHEMVDVSLLVAPVRLSESAHGLYYTYRDIRGQKEAEARLQHLAMHDALTGLPNRALFRDRLNLMLARLQRRPERHFAMMFLDLDHFKSVNDSLGHAAGDALLLEMARRLVSCVRPQDTMARFGGDEFAILLDEAAGQVDVGAVADRIQRAVRKPVPLGDDVVHMSASIGIALVDNTLRSPEEVVHAADVAMYRAKAKGKGRHEFAGDTGNATIHA